MNLIEQLGGYDAAKDVLCKLIGENKDIVTSGKTVIVANEIQYALLEYRRQNNIFEVGDLVVFKKEYSKESTIHKIDSLRAGTKCLRHATDKEIAQGFRGE